MSKYNNLKNNQIYKNHKLWNETHFYELMVSTLLAKEEEYIRGPIQYIKFIKDETQLGLKYCKEWYDLLKELGFIWSNFNIPVFKIIDEIEEINSMEDLCYIIDHDLNINQFLSK
jgi:hypothetical protein